MLPYIVHKRMPYIVHKRMPYIVHKKRMSYVPVHKRMSLEEDNLGSVSLVVELEEVKLIYSSPPQLCYPQLSYFCGNGILNCVQKKSS